MPSFCVSLDTSSFLCSFCFKGYTLSSDQRSCSLDTTCNASSTCTTCANGFYLSSKQCVACPSLPANCQTCSPSTPAQCIKCNVGFYLNTNNVCTACGTGCLECLSATFCEKAAAGFFISLQADGTSSGVLTACSSSCTTCVLSNILCTSCNTAVSSLNGTKCVPNNRVFL